MSSMKIYGMILAAMSAAMGFAQDDRFFTVGLEINANARDSEARKVSIPFPFPDFFLPPGETQGSLETVDSGSHLELSRITLYLEGRFNSMTSARLKLDGIDKYDRNPTSTDNELDVDEAWVQFGHKTRSDRASNGSHFYMKLGKFEKFERQNDRHLESYGLVSTNYNRFEDAGLELGADFGRHVYARVSYTAGNPLFMRDPNALAGDNGTAERDPFANPFPQPDLKSGFPMLYDAELEDIDFGDAEIGAGLGLRFVNDYNGNVVNFLFYGYQRDLKESADITGSFYGGDLDLLLGVSEELGPAFAGGLPLDGDKKEELGANLWLYMGRFTLFAQAIDAEIAGLEFDAYELEAAYAFDSPWIWGVGGKPLFSRFAPSARYSRQNPGFTGNGAVFPTPSIWWEWEKLDYGLRVSVLPELRLTLELSENQFFRGGEWVGYDEFLATLSWRWFSGDRLDR